MMHVLDQWAMETAMSRSALYGTGFLACAVVLSPAPALSLTPAGSGKQAPLLSQSQLHPVQQCWRRIGPFATQDTAWARWRQAQGMGYSVSNGVVPCWDSGARGYCFNVFFAC